MLETEIKALTAAVEALTAAMLAAQPIEAGTIKEDEPKTKAKKAKVEVSKEENPQITMDDLTRMCLGLARDGHRDAIKTKLASLDVGRVGELKGDAYETFSDWAVALAERAEPSA